ncbi:MAG: ABC transporter permease [Lachnospiraceae bacterium]|nr:ABC transporter permease [Lachnospiraceae bacterium]
MTAFKKNRTVFFLYLAEIRYNLPAMLMYMVIFMSICVAISRSRTETMQEMFEKTAVPVAVIDRDESELSKGLIAFLGQENKVISSDGEENELTRQLYYREIGYVLTIPEGFGASFADALTGEAKEEMSLEVVKLPDHAAGYYLDADIEQFLSRVKAYLAAGDGLEEALDQTLALREHQAEVRIAEGAYAYDNMPRFTYTFNYYPYLYLSVLTYCVGFVLKTFREKKLADRLNASPIPAATRNLHGIAAFSVVFFVFWLLSLLIPLVTDGTSFYTSPHRGLYLINTVAFLLVAASIAFFIGHVAKNEIAITALTNVVGLGMCFLGGVFVPLDVLSENVQKFSRFLPSYWYVRVCNMLGMRQGDLTAADFGLFRESMLFQCVFAAALLMLTLYIVKKRSENV